jgi:DNA-binding NtrC family response regulator
VAVRIVTATNKDPQKMIEAGKFREDLYYRLNVLPIHLPPLRERREDIALIAHHLLRQLSASNRKPFRGFTREAMRDLEKYPWPGNVRELQNVLEQAVVLHEGDRITSEMLPRSLREDLERPDLTRAERTPRSEAGADAVRPFWQIERDEIQHALDLCRGNVQEAARRLELSPATLYRKIERYGLVR